MKNYLKINIIVISLILLIGCNENKIELINQSETIENLELMNEELTKVIKWYEKHSLFSKIYDKIDMEKIYLNYTSSKEVIRKNSNNKLTTKEIVENNFLNLNKYLDEKLGTNARWIDIRKSINSVEKKISKQLETYTKRNKNEDLTIQNNAILINIEIMYNMIFQIIYSNKFEYELNFGSHEAQVLSRRKIDKNLMELEIGVFTKESDTYKIELYCDEKKVDLNNSRAKYRYNINDIENDSLKIEAKTIHSFNGIEIIYTNKYKIK